jgi:hypothetical protein
MFGSDLSSDVAQMWPHRPPYLSQQVFAREDVCSDGMDPDDPKKLTPNQRILRARIAAHASWAKETDRTARTEPGRKALMDRFEREVDPEGKLPPAERAKRAENARKAYYTALALKSAKARAKRAK